LVDDVKSMRSYWSDVDDTLTLLAYVLKDNDGDGMDLYFSSTQQGNGPDKHAPRRRSSILADVTRAQKLNLSADSDISDRLAEILQGYQRRISKRPQQAPGVPASNWGWLAKAPKRMCIYVLTNGVWRASSKPGEPIQSLVEMIKEKAYERKDIGISFIAFGNEPMGLKRMRDLVDNSEWEDMLVFPSQVVLPFVTMLANCPCRDIVYMEPFGGNFVKMIAGSVRKDLDGVPRQTSPYDVVDYADFTIPSAGPDDDPARNLIQSRVSFPTYRLTIEALGKALENLFPTWTSEDFRIEHASWDTLFYRDPHLTGLDVRRLLQVSNSSGWRLDRGELHYHGSSRIEADYLISPYRLRRTRS
jgi:hypothetical protein